MDICSLHAPATLSQRKYWIVARVCSWDRVDVLGAREISFLLQGITKKWREWKSNPPDWTWAFAVRCLFLTPWASTRLRNSSHPAFVFLLSAAKLQYQNGCLLVLAYFVCTNTSYCDRLLFRILIFQLSGFNPYIRFFPVSKGVYISE